MGARLSLSATTRSLPDRSRTPAAFAFDPLDWSLPADAAPPRVDEGLQTTLAGVAARDDARPFNKERASLEELQSLQNTFLQARIVKATPSLFRKLPEALRRERVVAMAAVSADGFSLEYASQQLREDVVVVTVAVRQSGRALQFERDKLRNNIQIATRAAKNDGQALEFASEALRNDGGGASSIWRLLKP